jgi:hypothetical protein
MREVAFATHARRMAGVQEKMYAGLAEKGMLVSTAKRGGTPSGTNAVFARMVPSCSPFSSSPFSYSLSSFSTNAVA